MYKLMTAGPTEVRENVLKARSMPFTNPDIDSDFFDYYKKRANCSKKHSIRIMKRLFWEEKVFSDLRLHARLLRNPVTGFLSLTTEYSEKVLPTL